MPRVLTLEERSVPAHLVSSAERSVQLHAALFVYCLGTRKDLMTANLVRFMPADVWPDVPRARRQQTFENLVQDGFWRSLPRRGKMHPFIPVVRGAKVLDDVLRPPPVDVAATDTFPETFLCAAFTDSEAGTRDTELRGAAEGRAELGQDDG